MGLLRRLSVTQQLLILFSVTIGIFAAFAFYYFRTNYETQTIENYINKSKTMSLIFADNASAGVDFDDVDTISEAIAGAQKDSTIEFIFVYDNHFVLDELGSVDLELDEDSKIYKNKILNKEAVVEYKNDKTLTKKEPLHSKNALALLVNDNQFVDSINSRIIAKEPIKKGSEIIGDLVLVTNTDSIKADMKKTSTTTAIVFSILFAFLVVVIFLVSGTILKPIKLASEIANQIANGELDVPLLDESGKDELAKMNAAINFMVKSLRDVLNEVAQSNENIKKNVAEIQASTVQQRHGLENQASSISEISTTINQLKTTAKQSANIAQRVLDDSEKSVEVSQEGLVSNEKAVDGMNQINEQMENIAETIFALSERSQQIVDIVSTVNDLAQQSNFLALNASIEAAKAGEHGKGFAVVAMEVRNLAEQSQQATAQIKDILNEIQGTMNSAVLVTENGTQKVGEGVHLIQSTGSVINQLADVVNQSSSSARQISASANQQSLGVDQIAQAISSISQTMNETTNSAKLLENTADDMANIGKRMSNAIETYMKK